MYKLKTMEQDKYKITFDLNNIMNVNKIHSRIMLDQMIQTARTNLVNFDLESINMQIKTLSDSQSNSFYVLRKSVLEEVLNAFNISCTNYLSNSICQESFEKDRKDEVLGLFKNKIYSDMIHSCDDGYLSLKEVYKLWS